MSDSKVEVKACRKCGGTARYREDGLWFVECSVCGEYEGPHARKVEAKKMWNIKNTIANNGVSFDSIVDKLTHLNGDHLMGLELNDIHIIANFITRLPTTAPRGGM